MSLHSSNAGILHGDNIAHNIGRTFLFQIPAQEKRKLKGET